MSHTNKTVAHSARRLAYDAPKRLYSIVSSAITPPLLVFFLVFGLTLVTYWISVNSLRSSRMDTLEKNVTENQVKFTNDLQTYAQILWGGVGRINSGPVDRASWQQFMAAYNIQKNYPGVRGIGIVQMVPTEAEAAFTAQKSSEYGRPITLYPATDQPVRGVFSYFEPETQNSASTIGFDAMHDERRRTIMYDAAASGQPTLTSDVGVIYNHDNKPVVVPSQTLLMYVPYYDQSLPLQSSSERKTALRGFVVATFSAQELFSYVFRNNDFANMHIAVSTADSENVLYNSGEETDLSSATRITQTVALYNQPFSVTYSFRNTGLAPHTQANTPIAILIGGTICAGVFALITYYVMRSRYHRLSYEKERDVKLAKDDLLSLASHQLRTPATGVKQYVGMVLQGFAGPISRQQRQFLEKAYASNDRQLHIINDILYLAKLDAGRMVMAKTSFDLAGMVRDVVDEQKQDARKEKLTLTVKAPKKAMCNADAHMIRMVIENLLSNAIKYTDSGGNIHVRVRSTKTDIKLIVTDTGVGIDQKDFKNLFQQFNRIPNSRSHLVSGTGVGLYLAKHFVALHGGTVTVSSELGQGTSFTVSLPK